MTLLGVEPDGPDAHPTKTWTSDNDDAVLVAFQPIDVPGIVGQRVVGAERDQFASRRIAHPDSDSFVRWFLVDLARLDFVARHARSLA